MTIFLVFCSIFRLESKLIYAGDSRKARQTNQIRRKVLEKTVGWCWAEAEIKQQSNEPAEQKGREVMIDAVYACRIPRIFRMQGNVRADLTHRKYRWFCPPYNVPSSTNKLRYHSIPTCLFWLCFGDAARLLSFPNLIRECLEVCSSDWTAKQ